MSTVYITGIVNEINQIDNEIKRINKNKKDLNGKRRKLEEELKKYMKENNEDGFRYNDLIVTINEKNSRKRKNKNEKEESVISVLRKHNIHPSKELLNDIHTSQKGKEYIQEVLKISTKK